MLNKLLKKHLKNEKGLTLIELLVVIVILGIIAAIAVVSIGGIIGDTEEKATVTEAVQIINAAKLAHSSEGIPDDDSWNAADLTQFISNVESTATWTVTLDETTGVYSINGHEAAPIVTETESATTATEAQLTNFIDGQ
jgi:type IV pilus assembly protein PilA